MAHRHTKVNYYHKILPESGSLLSLKNNGKAWIQMELLLNNIMNKWKEKTGQMFTHDEVLLSIISPM